jgi:two-component system sensor histidine kinase/response regulator
MSAEHRIDILKVLVADDEPGIRHSIKRALKNYTFEMPVLERVVSFEVQDVDSGEAALELLEKEPQDLLLLDYKMGGMTGLEVLERVHKQPHEMLALMVTAFATIETAVRATKSGAFDFIAKPFTPEELRDTVRKAAGHLIARRRARELADEKRRVRFDFIRVLGHELKAPLGAIESFLRILEDHAAGDDLTSYDEIVKRCLRRALGMRKLISDLLDMTRIESGEKQRELGEQDLVAIAKETIETHSASAAERRIKLQLDAPARIMMQGDPSELEIVLGNLVSNAIKYNKDDGTVDVRLREDEDRVRLDVTDTGIGMKPEDAARLFGDFVRIKNKDTRNILGSGLGLSIVKKIATLYGGDVSVQSSEGEGSTFTVVLQTQPQSEAAQSAAPQSEANG